MAEGHIAIIGSGLIGRSWAMVFLSAGHKVIMYDIDSAQLKAAHLLVHNQLLELEKNGTIRGHMAAEKQCQLLTETNSLQECVNGAWYVQECVPENLQLKVKVLTDLDALIDEKTIVASSTSCILPSKLAETLKHRANFLVAHPVNPPYFVPLVELVPSPWTLPAIVQKTKTLMSECGQSPITLNKELPGFALNRIQYAILQECWSLVSEGALSVEDVDKVMTDGLGPRYAFIGPLETAHLNAEGFQKYCETYGSTIFEVCKTLKPLPKMEGDVLKDINSQLNAKTPVSCLPEKRLWRDENLIQLSLLKREMSKESE